VRVIKGAMTNDKVQNPKGKRSGFGIQMFGFWDLEFSQWDCHTLPACHCETDEVSRSNPGGVRGLA